MLLWKSFVFVFLICVLLAGQARSEEPTDNEETEQSIVEEGPGEETPSSLSNADNLKPTSSSIKWVFVPTKNVVVVETSKYVSTDPQHTSATSEKALPTLTQLQQNASISHIHGSTNPTQSYHVSPTQTINQEINSLTKRASFVTPSRSSRSDFSASQTSDQSSSSLVIEEFSTISTTQPKRTPVTSAYQSLSESKSPQPESMFSSSIDHQQQSSSPLVYNSVSIAIDSSISSRTSNYEQSGSISSTALPRESQTEIISSSSTNVFPKESVSFLSSPTTTVTPEESQSQSSSSSQMQQSSESQSQYSSVDESFQSSTSILDSSTSISPSESIFETHSASVSIPTNRSVSQSTSLGQQSSISIEPSSYSNSPISSLGISTESVFETQSISSSESVFETQTMSSKQASTESLVESLSISTVQQSSSEMKASFSSSMFSEATQTNSISSSIDQSIAISTSITPSSASSEVVSSSIFIIPQVPSASPTNLTAFARSSTQINLAWNEPPLEAQNGEILSYAIKVLLPVSNKTEQVLNTTHQFYNVINLRKFTNYTFMVSAVNENGEGPPAQVMQRTLPDLPESAPTNLTAKALTFNTIQLSWHPIPAALQNGIIHIYKVEVRIGETIVETFNATDTDTYTIINLNAFTNYTFVVSGFNQVGESPKSSISERTLATLPESAPTNLTANALSSTTIQLNWLAPPFESLNGIFKVYSVRVKKEGDASIEQHLNTTETFYNITNLSVHTEYTFEVRAKNQIGESPEATVTERTLSDIPSIVRNFTCLESLQNSITLEWLAPENPNGIIENYRISRTDLGEHEDLNKNILEKTFTGLHPYRRYNFTIQARTDVGYGDIAEVSCMTKESEPDVPDNLRHGIISSYWFTLLWDAPSKVHGQIIAYHLEIRTEKIIQSFKEELNGDKIKPSMVFNMSFDVTPFTHYACSVIAETSVGKGHAARVNLTTKAAAPSPVLNLEPTNIFATSITLNWREPVDVNGIVRYRIFQIETDSENMTPTQIVNELKQTVYRVEKGIKPFRQYNFSVQAYTSGGNSTLETITVRSDSAKPGIPNILNLRALSNSSIAVTWQLLSQSEGNGIVTKYQIHVKKNEIQIQELPYEVDEKDTDKSNVTLSVRKLAPFTKYRFSIAAINDKGMGEFSPYNEKSTLPGRPGKPRSLTVSNISGFVDTTKSVRIDWQEPVPTNGIIESYKITLYKGNSVTRVFQDAKTTMKEVAGLDPFASYRVEVQAFNSIFGPKATVNFTTISAAPSGPPLSFTIVKKENTAKSITMRWSPPREPNGFVTKYFIMYDKEKSSIKREVEGDKQKIEIDGLKPFTAYQFVIQCESTGGLGPKSNSIQARTLATVPVIPSVTPKPLLDISDTTITIQMWTPSDDNGQINFYYIVVLDASESPTKAPSDYTDDELKDQTYDLYKQANTDGETTFKPYITASLSRDQFLKLNNGTFVIGQSTQSNTRLLFNVPTYVNGPLFKGRNYQYFLRAHISQDLYISSPNWQSAKTTGGPIKKPGTGEGSDIAGPIAGTFVAIIVVLVLAIGYVYYRRRQQLGGTTINKKVDAIDGGEENKGYLDDPVHVPAAHPVKVENYQAYVRNLAKDGKYLFSEEFKMILRGRSGYNCLYEHSNHPINRDKNRYNNIAAYDHTRVLLEPLEGIPESDYINSNYIDGYMEQAAYIACQGPLEGTCEDMWRMCWEKDVSTIVMLTQCVENGRDKCYHYWPEVGTKCYGSMEVTLTESTFLPVYSMRTFSLLNDQHPGSEKFVRHFAFCGWPDHGTPNSQQLLTFIRRVNQCHQPNSGPIVVHCSAGVGRTGTYIVMDVNLKRIKTEQNIEIYNYLQHIRSQRNHMVQTESQYVFIHDALLEYLTFGTTEINVRDLRDYVKKLQQTVDSGMETHLDKEFQKLNHFDQSGMKSMNAANSSYNKAKNRFLNVLPYDDTRVSLTHLPGIPGSDYINANYINGYNMSKLFIATQAPLPQTIPAFWRLVWEHQCMTIVCLAQETENGKVKIHRYWPSIEAAMHGTLMIENIDEQVHNEYIVRDFKVTHTTDGLSRKIRHFQYTAWPDNAYPESGSGFVDMIGQVQKWHQQNEIGQIVVHCSAGVGRTGVFIGLCNLIERVKIEGYVDVFHVVREMRTQRPAMVQTKVQYLFCYLALQDFLASFDIYQNFM